MASTWGTSWTTSWATSWGGDGAAPVARKYPAPAGKKTRGRAKRWWHIGDRIYLGTRKDAAEMWRAFLSEQEGIPAPKPRLQSRPAPKAEVVNVDVPVPEVVYTAFDWESFYRSSMAQQDVEAAEMLIAAMRKRLEDEEDDIEALLLLA